MPGRLPQGEGAVCGKDLNMTEEKMKNENNDPEILRARFAQIHQLMKKAVGKDSRWSGEAADVFAVREQELYEEVLLILNKMGQEGLNGE